MRLLTEVQHVNYKVVRHFFFYTTKFSIQPNYNPTRWITTKKFQMADDKKNQNGRRQKQLQNIQNCLGPLHAPFGVS